MGRTTSKYLSSEKGKRDAIVPVRDIFDVPILVLAPPARMFRAEETENLNTEADRLPDNESDDRELNSVEPKGLIVMNNNAWGQFIPPARKAHKSNFGHGGGGEHKKPKKKSRATVVDKDKE
ncbi:hypothetical protein PRIPAC_90641 [Pristionchus pacificus]|uniref:Uncharacterized protein n=1 Tax=Pristionchus pacificus TaxID=54126 RepID=A0A2A6CXL4_PRIPA|nr:hypothetical protein PRIPAC_90641 [Pristionchus pacificus]|eukprot:PDM82962.1 hypothetical protein PRIPAC_37355 [Pristionchus pacificus]